MSAPDSDRKTFIGGSDIAAIIGMGASYGGMQATPFTVWQQKVGEVEGEMDAEKRRFLERRKRWEPVVRQMLEEEFGAEITAFNQRYVDPEVPYFAAELDFEWRDPSDGSVQNGEIKTVSPRAFSERFGWGEAGTDQVPVNYLAQCQWGLMVARRTKAVLVAMVGLDDMLFYPIARDDEAIANMREAALAFWTDHVLTKRPPEAQTWTDVQRIMLRRKERPAQLSPEIYAKLRELQAVRDAIAAHEGTLEELSFEVGDFVCKAWDEANPYAAPAAYRLDKKKQLVPDTLEDGGLYFDGQKVATWNKQSAKRIDVARLKEEHPEIAQEFTRETQSRVLRISKPKA